MNPVNRSIIEHNKNLRDSVIALTAAENANHVAIKAQDVTHHTAALSVHSDVKTLIENSIGHTNNTVSMGDGSNQLRTVSLGYDRTGGKARSILVDSGGITQVHDSVVETSLTSLEGKIDTLDAVQDSALTKLNEIATNTANINVNVGDVEVNTNDLEVLQASTNTKLDSILSKNGEIESSANALIAANHTDLVALEASLTSIEGKQDDIKTLIGTTNSGLSSIDSGINDLDTLLGDIQNDNNSKSDHLSDNLDTLNGKIDTLTTRIKLANSDAHLAVSLEDIGGVATQTTAAAILAKNTEIETLIGTTNSGLSSIDSGINGLDTLLGDIQTDNNNKSDHLSDNLDTLNGKIDTLTTRIKLANSDAHLAVSLEDIGGVATQTTAAAILAKNTEIETSAIAIQAAVEGTLTVGSHAVTNAGTFAVQSTVAAALPAGTNAIGKLAANSGVDIGDVDVTSISAGTNRIGMMGMKANQAADGSGTERFVLCDAAGHLQVDVLSGGGSTDVSGVATHAKQDTIIGHLDGVEGKLDAIETTNNAIQAAVEGTLTVGSHAVTNAGTFAVQSTVAAALPAGNNNIGNVDIASALPAGTNAIGKLSANSGVDIGDVDVTSISAGTNRIGMVGMKANQAADGSGTERFVLCDAAGHLQVDVLSGGGSTDVSALSTHAKQDTIIGHLDGVEGKLDAIETTNNACQVLLGTIDADTNAIKTAVEILDNAISGNEMQVDVVSSALPSGAATQTTLASVLAKNTEIETTADAILAKNTEIETTADAILAKNTELETLLTSIAPRTATGTLSAATDLADGAALAIVDTDGYRYMTIFGKATTYVDLHIQYSLTNSAGAMISLYNETPYKLQTVSPVNSIYTFNATIEHMARYVRFINFSGSQVNALTLYYQLSN